MAEYARRHLVAYDIVNDLKRSRLARKLEGYGDRVQYSVFVVDARPARLHRLRIEIEAMIDPLEDSILICDLGLVQDAPARHFQLLGRARPITTHGPLVL